MNKKLYGILILFAVILLVTGCGTKTPGGENTENNVPDTTAGGGAQTTEPVIKTKYNHLFDYSKVSSFQYRISTSNENARATLDVEYSITPDASLGVEAWLVSTSTVEELGTTKTNMWISKETHKCLKWEGYVEANGQKLTQPGACPLAGLNSENYGNSELANMGKEEISIPLGTYNADRYDLEGITFWSTPEIAVPLKIIYNDGSVKMVLMKYT